MENLKEQLVALPQYLTGYKLLKRKNGTFVQIEVSTYTSSEEVCAGAEKLSFSTSSNETHMLVDLPQMRGLTALRDKRNRGVSQKSPVFTEFLAEHGLKISDFETKPTPKGIFKLKREPVVALFHRLTDKPVINSKTKEPYPYFFYVRARTKKYEPKAPWADYSDVDLLELASFNGVALGRTRARAKVIAKLEAAGLTPE